MADLHGFDLIEECEIPELNSKGQILFLGSQEAIEAANAERDGWLDVKKVL